MARPGSALVTGVLALVLACSSTPPDPTGGTIGAACTTGSQCLEGLAPECFASTFGAVSTGTSLPGGYCSSTCRSNADCGASGSCVAIVSGGTACVENCGAPSECRTGYACWTGGYCFPGTFDCDPMKGTCTTPGGAPGGCARDVFGTGLAGECLAVCAPGPGTCSKSSDGSAATHCIFADFTTEPDGAPTRDLYRGTICAPETPDAAADGQPCNAPGDCVDGDECNMVGPFPLGKGFDSTGDNRCHMLCSPAKSAAPCPPAQTCFDVWGTFATANPVGLCR